MGLISEKGWRRTTLLRRFWAGWVGALLAVVVAAPLTAASAFIPADTSAVSYSFVPTGSMTVIRNRLIAVSPLPNGKVLIAGGEDMNAWASAELYDPGAGTFSATGLHPMLWPLEEAVAAPLPNGDVLVAGGVSPGPVLRTAQLFDPATGEFSDEGVGQMIVPRDAPAAAPLTNGEVLIVGGFDGMNPVASAELFNPESLQFTDRHVGSMALGRWGPIAAPLPDGKVLVAGGVTRQGITATAELYNPATGQFSSDGVGHMTVPRAFAMAAPLPNGEVLIAGGITDSGGAPVASAELFDPVSGTFSSAGVGALTTPRMQAGAAVLPDGDVLVAGGAGPTGELSSAEIFNVPPAAVAPRPESQLVVRRVRYVERIVSRHGHRRKVKLTIVTGTRQQRTSPIFTATPARAILSRGSHVYGTGTAALTRLVIYAPHQIRPGQYLLTLRHPLGRRWLITRSIVTVSR